MFLSRFNQHVKIAAFTNDSIVQFFWITVRNSPSNFEKAYALILEYRPDCAARCRNLSLIHI